MNVVQPDMIRNVVLVGHAGTGKTSLAEALLVESGSIARMGRIEDGTTVCDSDPLEQRHGISLSFAIAPFMWKEHKINLIDTPGYADFEYEVAIAMEVADLAVFVVSAVDGVEVQHERLWHLAAESGLPRMLFVNKLDRENADFDATLDGLRRTFGAGIAPLELPIGNEAAFAGVADLLTDTAHFYDDGTKTTGEIPDELEESEHRVHDNLVEGIVVADDSLLERFLDGDVPPVEDLERTLAHGVDDATVFPVVCGSATSRIAIDRLADFICEIGPSPLDRPPTLLRSGTDAIEVVPDPQAPAVAHVFKTFTDPYVGQISLLDVITGTIRDNDHLANTRTGTEERLHGLFTLVGREHREVSAAIAGDIVAVAKLTSTATGDTLSARPDAVVRPFRATPAPVHAIAIRARVQADEDRLANALHRLTVEDPTLSVDHVAQTHQTLLRGMGDTHLTNALERLEDRFGVTVDTEDVRVTYLETISQPASAEGRYKKQSGGHGQFGVAEIRIEPLPRGAGFEFIDSVVGGAIPRQYIPAVEHGIEETMQEGGVFGFPVVDVRVECLDGKYHPVDSSEMSFKMAGRLAIREAPSAAGPVILEPISLVEVTVSSDLQGEIMGDLNSRRAHIQGTEMADERHHVITALVPTAEILRYAIDLRSITSGRGSFEASHAHYEILPPNLVDSVVRSPST